MSLTCPRCRAKNVYRSRRRLYDFFFWTVGLAPFRCRACEHRFFRFRSRSSSAARGV